MDDDQSWTSQISGTGGMISSMNSRLFIIKRLSASISKNGLRRIVDSLYTSKVRYGLQLLGKVRLSDEDPTNGLLSKLQVTQNKMARFLNNSKISDKISNKEIFSKSNMLSVNQLNCQIKLTEVWKSLHNQNYPLQWDLKTIPSDGSRVTRSTNKLTIIESLQTCQSSTSFLNDAARIWNKAPEALKECTSIYSAKKQIKSFASSIPI